MNSKLLQPAPTSPNQRFCFILRRTPQHDFIARLFGVADMVRWSCLLKLYGCGSAKDENDSPRFIPNLFFIENKLLFLHKKSV